MSQRFPNPYVPSETMTMPNGYVSQCNTKYYATEETANLLMSLFNASSIVPADPRYSAFPGTSPAPARLLQFNSGSKIKDRLTGAEIRTSVPFTVNCGELADCFERMPEQDFKDNVFGTLALRYAWQQIYDTYAYAVITHGNQ